jgi:hypothetical protein
MTHPAAYSVHSGSRVERALSWQLIPSSGKVRYEWSYISTPPYAIMAFTDGTLLFTGHLVDIPYKVKSGKV